MGKTIDRLVPDDKSKHVLVIFLLSLAVYANTIDNEFVWDDSEFMGERGELGEFSTILKYFWTGFDEGYSPLREAFYVLAFNAFGADPMGYRAVALITHALVSVMVYFLALEILKVERPSLVAAVLFALHPIHTENIAFTTSAIDQLGIFFYLCSLYLYIRGERKASIASAALAIFWGEVPITLPAVIILYDFCFKKTDIKNYFPYLGLAFAYLFIRFVLVGLGGRKESYLAGNFFLTQLTMGKAYVVYIKLLVLPSGLTVYHEIKAASSVFDTVALLSWAILLALFASLPRVYRSSRTAFFALAWFFITLSPFSNIVPLQNFMAERYLYLPSVGFCLLAAMAFEKAELRLPGERKIIPIAFFVAVAALFSIITIDRNADWQDGVTLWTKTIKTTPNSVNAHENLGLAYVDRGIYPLALAEFETAKSLRPDNPDIYSSTGNIYHALGDFDRAAAEFQKAAEIEPENPVFINNLASAYHEKGDYTMAITLYSQAIELAPYNKEYHKNLARTYYAKGDFKLAITELEKVLDLDYSDTNTRDLLSDAHNELGIAFGQSGQYDIAIEEFHISIFFNSSSAESYANLGTAYALTGETEPARDAFKRAMAIDPTNPTYAQALEDLQR